MYDGDGEAGDNTERWRWGRRQQWPWWTMKTVFNGGGGGGIQWRRQHSAATLMDYTDADVKAKMAIDTSVGRWQHRASAFDVGDG
jgi:hypothetical protein